MTRDLSRLAISLVTFGPDVPLRHAVGLCAKNDVRAVGLTREQVDVTGLKETIRILSGEGVRVTGYTRLCGFPSRADLAWQPALDDARKIVDQARQLGADHVVATGGGRFAQRRLNDALADFGDGLGQLLDDVGDEPPIIAVEPLHPMYACDRGVVTTLDSAVQLCRDLGSGVAVIIDAYHLWWSPTIARDIARSADLIKAYHISDWRIPTRDLLTDRAIMGDGVIDLVAIGSMVEATGYRGFHEVELFSRLDWWIRPPEETLSVCIDRYLDLTMRIASDTTPF